VYPEPVFPAPTFEQEVMAGFECLGDVGAFDTSGSAIVSLTGLEDLLNDDSLPRDVLDFGVELTFDTPSIFHTEFQFPTDQQLLQPEFEPFEDDPSVGRGGFVTPGLRGKVDIIASVQAFKESLWLWTPEVSDHSATEQRNLSLPWDSTSSGSEFYSEFPLLHRGVSSVTRGKILAMVLRTCEATIHSHVISHFPSSEVLTNLIQNFVGFHSQQDIMWIHPASIELNREPPLFLISMVAAGAAMSPMQEVRKLGFAMQEALRESLPTEVCTSSCHCMSFIDICSSSAITDQRVISGHCKVLP